MAKLTQEQLSKMDQTAVLKSLAAGLCTVEDYQAWEKANAPKTGGGFTVKVSEKTGILVFGGFSANPKNTVNVYEEPFYRWLAEINDPKSSLAKKLASIKAAKTASQGKNDPRFVKAA